MLITKTLLVIFSYLVIYLVILPSITFKSSGGRVGRAANAKSLACNVLSWITSFRVRQSILENNTFWGHEKNIDITCLIIVFVLKGFKKVDHLLEFALVHCPVWLIAYRLHQFLSIYLGKWYIGRQFLKDIIPNLLHRVSLWPQTIHSEHNKAKGWIQEFSLLRGSNIHTVKANPPPSTPVRVSSHYVDPWYAA